MAALFDSAGKTLTLLTGIIAVTVSFNTFLSSCSEQRMREYNSFRSAVASEEAYWKALYDDYLTVFSEDVSRSENLKGAKILAIHTLAQRQAPSFAEHAVPDHEKSEAQNRLRGMRANLLDALEDQRITNASLATELRRRSFVSTAAADPAVAGGAKGDVPARSRIPLAPPDAAVELSPNSDTGWDIDVFWCRGQDEGAYYQTALAVGEALAALALEERSIAPGVRLGRVRVRPASERLQKVPNSPARAPMIVYDSGPGEQAAAQALTATINASLGANALGFRTARSGGTATPWYLSVFACPDTIQSDPPAEALSAARS